MSKYFCVLAAVFFSFHGKAQESASDRYCGFLVQLSQSGKPNANHLHLIEVMNNVLELKSLETEAIQQRKSFEDFKNDVQKKRKTVADEYKSIYISKYAETYCGKISTEAAPEALTGQPSQLSKAAKQFDPTGHPYYKDMDKGQH